MPKTQHIDPSEMRKPGFVEFQPIPINQYQKTVKDEKGNFTNEEFKAIYHDMVLIREFETMINLIKTIGAYNGTSYNHPGPAHLSIGQESAAVGMAWTLTVDDFIFGSHRSHGEIVAKAFSAVRQLSDARLMEIMEAAPKKIRDRRHYRDFEHEIDEATAILTFSPKDKESYQNLFQLAEHVRNVIVQGIDDILRVVVRKETGEYILYTEGSNLKDVFDVVGVDTTRTRTNNISEIAQVLGIEAARNAVIHEAVSTLNEQGILVDVRHLMLVSDMMCMEGEVKQIGRHGISGEKESVLSRAAFEVTVNHLLDAAVANEVDELSGVTENVIVGQPIQLGTGDVKLIAVRQHDN